MSWSEIYSRMKSNPTNGSEFNNGEPVEGNPAISRTVCDYCGCEVLCIWDDHNKNSWWPYLGNQARKPNTYKYSPIIQAMRRYFDAEGAIWTQEKGNNLMNLHARAHCEPEDWSKRGHPNGVKILCSRCFQKTYNRTRVLGNNGTLYALTVIPERGETIESVMQDLGIEGKVVGTGAITNY